jgi:hypothetical protein
VVLCAEAESGLMSTCKPENPALQLTEAVSAAQSLTFVLSAVRYERDHYVVDGDLMIRGSTPRVDHARIGCAVSGRPSSATRACLSPSSG